MENTTLNVRIDKDVKTAAEKVFEDLGINMSTAITIFLKKAIRDNGIPFDLRLGMPNAVTLAAMKEADRILNDPNAKRYSTIEEFRESLKI